MANDKLTLIRHLKELATRCSTMVNNKISALTNSISEDLDEVYDEIDSVYVEIADLKAKHITPQDYGAKGDGTTDDTAAFQNALAENRVVFVPGGTYKLSGTLVIRPNCCLELSQDTVLNFTQTTGNCIELRSSATLRGNHGIVYVPYAFTGNAVALDADFDTQTNTPPYTHWDPMWKYGRYVYDVCIVKANSSGLHYSTDGACSGTALYMHADSTKSVTYMWGITTTGIRIAGAFDYGIRAINDGEKAWNHDMRIEAVIDSCEIGVALDNCNCVHLAATIQPRKAKDDTRYAKYGVFIKDSENVDLIGSRVWDWHNPDPDKLVTLWTDGGEYQHIALYGNCPNLVLDDFLYNNQDEVRDYIYTDTASNFETMTILQEPITRWFKRKDGDPYYFDGYSEHKLIMQEHLNEYFNTDIVKAFTDLLPTAIDTDGSVYNGIGYKMNVEVPAAGGTPVENNYYVSTGFIPCKKGDKIYAEQLSFTDGWDSSRIVLFDANFNRLAHVNRGILLNGEDYFVKHEATTTGFICTVNPVDELNNVAYARFSIYQSCFGKNPMVAVNEEIKYSVEGFLTDGVKVKGENILIQSPGGKTFELSVSDTGELSTTIIE